MDSRLGPLMSGQIWKVSESLIEIDGDRVLGVNPPELAGGPFRVTAFFKDSNGQPVLFIENNEWRTPSSNWDVEISGPRITIRQKAGEISLILRTEARRAIVIEQLKLEHNGNRIEGDSDALVFTTPAGIEGEYSGLQVDQCRVGIQIKDGSVAFGVGSGSIFIKRLCIKTVRHPGSAEIPAILPLTKRVGRNDPCPCGNGKKFKKCHGF